MRAHLLINGKWTLTELTPELLAERGIVIRPRAIIHEACHLAGGVFEGGVFRDGVFEGGTWHKAPLQIQMSTYFFNVSGPDTLQIGCENHPIEYWEANLDEILAEYNVSDMAAEIRMYIRWAREWFKLNNNQSQDRRTCI